MSLLTTSTLKVTPTSSVGLAVAAPVTAWTFGAWVEALSSAAANTAIAGFYVYGAESAWVELEIGSGAAGSETVIGRFKWFVSGGGNTNVRSCHLPVPMGGVATGARISFRVRDSSGIANTKNVALIYYESFDGSTMLTPGCSQVGAVGASVAVNTTAWTNSSFVEMLSGEPAAISLYGVTISTPTAEHTTQYEIDIATGAVGSETVIQTITFSRLTGTQSAMRHESWLPKVRLVATTTRVSVRVRKSGTDATALGVALLYYNDTIVTNTAPVVNAGPDQTVTFPNCATLAGSATDDGLP